MAHNNIESDRRSAVSSFYGGRKSSVDMLQSDLNMRPPAGQASSRHERDDASSFYGSQRGPRGSADLLVNSQTAGYNRNSFFDVGRSAPVKGGRDEEDAAFLGARPGVRGDEEAGWDVFADFNNAGPRYSSAFVKYDEGYQQLPPDHVPRVHTPMKLEEDTATNASGAPVELVTVPALGAEWKKSEMEAMTKKGRRKQKDSNVVAKYRAWSRDQRGCCGKYGTRKQIAIGLFIICAIVAIVLAFTIPRVPSFSFNSSSPLQNGTAPPETIFSRSPANFSFAAKLDLEVSTTSNFLPLRFNHINAKVFDLGTNFQVGTGDLSTTVPARTFTEIFLPLNFTYIATNDTDITWNNWYNACRNSALNVNGSRPGLNFRLDLEVGIAGLIGNREISTQITNVECPFQLSITNG
ncbi:hypothetical protein EW145_g1739 [Phellinidium pouzarii]|uniref:Uncharacterized protein n=1 Tax=Phellinidium pouzarii TaxID=167371 RepID=A0A4S4LDC9_9AGAM|nr:hypothetical protein EW145_g1739 [Phellinidium pouzarii]